MRCMIGLPQGTWVRGSHGRCAQRATSIRRRRRHCGMWAAHAWNVRSCTISYDIWPPRYRTLDESAIDIAISCNRYDHYITLWHHSQKNSHFISQEMLSVGSKCQQIVWSLGLWPGLHWDSLHGVSKNGPPLTCYNVHIHDLITIIFGRSVTNQLRNQTMRCFPTLLT